ncbi:hypothetical protein MKW98_025952 [Papaver atlanticum]|uniref:E2F/DP family winged-helix DNA-binding domain-containing protein n=1 Tax=Papaver atlanticum TaxID=357466 RepID=A0AAD4SK08_9MAGN|nr:hypothetical protein MKW98_025952 [Papaver atlanticum]
MKYQPTWVFIFIINKRKTSRSVGFSPSSKTFNKFNVQAEYDDAWSAGNNKKNKAQTGAVGGGGEKAGGRGLLESNGRTTYNEVTDELKNIRRRVYDSLNVLIATDIISKDKNKEIQWRGMLHAAVPNAIEQLKLEDQFVGLQNLAQRNEQLCCSWRKAATSGGVPFPFIII